MLLALSNQKASEVNCTVTRTSNTDFTIQISGATHPLKFSKEEELRSIVSILTALESQLEQYFRSEQRRFIKLLLCGMVYILNWDSLPEIKCPTPTYSFTCAWDRFPPNCSVIRKDANTYEVSHNSKMYSLSFPKPEEVGPFDIYGMLESKMKMKYEHECNPVYLFLTGTVYVMNFQSHWDSEPVKTINWSYELAH